MCGVQARYAGQVRAADRRRLALRTDLLLRQLAAEERRDERAAVLCDRMLQRAQVRAQARRQHGQQWWCGHQQR